MAKKKTKRCGGGKKKKEKPIYHTDEKGHYVWETVFLHGKQKRQKRRVDVIDGGVVVDLDAWLMANADDIALHEMERWDLIEARKAKEETPKDAPAPGPPSTPARAEGTPVQTERGKAMSGERRPLRLSLFDLEHAFEMAKMPDLDFGENHGVYLDRTNGKVIYPEDAEAADDAWMDKNLLSIPDDPDALGGRRDGYAAMEDFIASLDAAHPAREKLADAIVGKGAFRRFRDIVYGGGDVALKRAWDWFETRRGREAIVEWLRGEGIEPEWVEGDIFEPPKRPDKRVDLLRAVLQFVRDVRRAEGVRRVALLGSLATFKAIPGGIDLLVEVEDGASLSSLARRKRQLTNKAMHTGDSCGADVFLCNPRGEYIGRVCWRKQCAPAPLSRSPCDAQHCGRRQFLHDDFQYVKLERGTMANAPLELWPEVVARADLPEDVVRELINPLREGRGGG